MIRPTDLHGLPAVVRRLEDYLGFEYMTLREFSSSAGSLDEPPATAAEPSVELVGAWS